MPGMARTIALAHRLDMFATARTIIVSGCAVALIVAERFLPAL
tara:strand:- start:1022 stop:1150 length:129 start_codon:yes stop_codon:yes gene_type:complete